MLQMERRFYKRSELIKMGFSDWEIRCDCNSKGQTFATQTAGGQWRIDLEKYLKFRQKRTRPRVR